MTYSQRMALTYGPGAIFSGGSDLAYAIESAKRSVETQNSFVRPEARVGCTVVELPGKDGPIYRTYSADAWEKPDVAGILPWEPPPPVAKPVAHVAPDGKVTMLTGSKIAAVQWTTDRRYPKVWKTRINGWNVNVWEVAAREGRWQWSADKGDRFMGGSDWYEDRAEAEHDAVTSATQGFQSMGSVHTAHDSGDGADISHCPFCGSGSVIGGHDGTVTCEFCHRFFTVQVQPEFRGMPQTINGQPFDVPGMPGQGPDAGAAQQEQATEAGDALLDGDPRGLSTAPGSGDAPPKKPPAAKGVNPFAKASLLVTKEGMALPPEAYIQHLALLHAADRDAVLLQVRTENAQ